MIANIQVLRAFAALAVTFYHAGFAINGVHTELQGVALFFCVSGFIMVHVSREKSTEGFFAARVARVVPLYWLATVGFYFWTHLGLSNPPYAWPLLLDFLLHHPGALLAWLRDHHGLNGETALALAKSLLFIPYEDKGGELHPVLGVGWTLNLEMFFYALFALALRISRRWAPLVVGAALLLVKLVAALIPDPLLAFYGHGYTTFFILGMAAYYVWRATPTQECRKRRAGLAGAAAIAVTAFVLWSFRPGGDLVTPISRAIGLAFPPSLLMFALWLHSAGITVRSRLWLLLGAASYSLYLVHPFVMETARPVGDRWAWLHTGQSVSGLLLAMLASAVLAVLVHRFIEVPISRQLRRRTSVVAGHALGEAHA